MNNHTASRAKFFNATPRCHEAAVEISQLRSGWFGFKNNVCPGGTMELHSI
jgi:hypothetical protein